MFGSCLVHLGACAAAGQRSGLTPNTSQETSLRTKQILRTTCCWHGVATEYYKHISTTVSLKNPIPFDAYTIYTHNTPQKNLMQIICDISCVLPDFSFKLHLPPLNGPTGSPGHCRSSANLKSQSLKWPSRLRGLQF